ncbi:hypothetical protein LguiB_018952 [Lonicera macranthoides]
MAILRTNGASSSSSSPAGHRYQVFLSFRGKDTRKTFTDHLYTALVQAGIHTFRDEHELKRGEHIANELREAIKESRIAVIVFSRNYASSDWCLDELVGILERKKTMGLTVIPVFYDVQPSDVRYQKGSFGEAFSIHQGFEFESEELMNKMEKWRAALREVADLGGMVLQNEADGYEAKFIQEIVEHVKGKLNPAPFQYPSPYPNPIKHLERMVTRMGSNFSEHSRGFLFFNLIFFFSNFFLENQTSFFAFDS